MKATTPIPLSEKEQAKLTKLPLKIVIAYNNGARNLNETDLKKLNFLKTSWENRLSLSSSSHSLANNLNIQQTRKLLHSIKFRLCEIDYKLYDYERQLNILNENYSKLPLKCLLLEMLQATKEADIYDEQEIDRLERLVYYELNRYTFSRKLELEHLMELLRAEQKVRLQMQEKLTTLLERLN